MSDQQLAVEGSLGLFARCARTLARTDELDDILEELLRVALDQSEAAAGAVFVADDDLQQLLMTVGIGLPAARDPDEVPASPDPSQYMVSMTSADALAEALRERRAILVEGVAGPPTRLLELTGQASALLVPLVVLRGGIEEGVGALGLCWADGATIAPADVLLSAIADLAATAIDRARSRSVSAERAEWQQRLAHTDPLTGLANRRTFDRLLELELARAGRQGTEVTLAVFDVDELAETNRSGGRPAGDEVLRGVAATLAGSVRLVDTVARLGADEFVVIAPGSAGTVVARRVLEGVGQLDQVAGRRVTVSAGVATFPADGASAEELLHAATAGLSSAKSGGGGRIGLAKDSTKNPG